MSAARLAAYIPWRTEAFARQKRLPARPDDLEGMARRRQRGGGKSTGDDWRAQQRAFAMIGAMSGAPPPEGWLEGEQIDGSQ